jgi:large subunit ribosomal protein L24
MAEKKFSISWRKSIKPRKQRLFRFNAPLHVKQKLMHVHLSPELRKKYNLRNIGLKKGDKKVKV